jgi:rSAM/selenodomain-associated transferase 1
MWIMHRFAGRDSGHPLGNWLALVMGRGSLSFFTPLWGRLIVARVVVPRAAMIVMTKFPAPGKVKTRLMAKFTANEAAAVHQIFVVHFIKRLADLRPAELIICFDPPEAREPMRELLADVGPMTLLEQVPGDLGERLASACESVFERHESVLVSGVDSPDVPDQHLRQAMGLANSTAVSLSRTDDGGFWSIGLRRTVNVAILLRNIPWSSGGEADATLQRAAELGYSAVLGPAWDDVDRPEDVSRLLIRLAASGDPGDQQLLTHLRRAIPHAESYLTSGAI